MEHVKIKHSNSNCKDCNERFSTSNDLLLHMADIPSKKTVQLEYVKANDDKNAKVEASIEDVKLLKCIQCNKLVSNDDTYMGGTRQDGKRLTIWEFYTLYIKYS